jgi:hypothetical protein
MKNIIIYIAVSLLSISLIFNYVSDFKKRDVKIINKQSTEEIFPNVTTTLYIGKDTLYLKPKLCRFYPGYGSIVGEISFPCYGEYKKINVDGQIFYKYKKNKYNKWEIEKADGYLKEFYIEEYK